MIQLGKEIRTCPERRPMALLVFALASLGLGAFTGAIAVALAVGAATGSGDDLRVVGALTAFFAGLGALLLVVRARRLGRALVYRVLERGIVRETRQGSDAVAFPDVTRLLVDVLRFARSGAEYYTIVLHTPRGASMRIESRAIDNVDASLVSLLERATGRRAEPLYTRRQ